MGNSKIKEKTGPLTLPYLCDPFAVPLLKNPENSEISTADQIILKRPKQR
jgi:hypothetical protein